MVYVVAVIGLLLGGIVCYFLLQKQLQRARHNAIEIQTRLESAELQRSKQERELQVLRDELLRKQGELGERNAELTSTKLLLAKEREETIALQDKLTKEFENIANRILKERSEDWSRQSEKSLSSLLNPLGQRIDDFKKQVHDAFNQELRDRISLKEEVKRLTELNSQVSQEANNLTKALKGDVKRQGNWGEVILERILETSGLMAGREYEREEVVTGADGNKLRPDVIIHLPDNKHIIIDSKVSLVAYERMISTTDDAVYAQSLKEHVESVKSHIKGLSEKNYAMASGINSPDFVLMFMPIESSFASVIQADEELYRFAWDRKIVLVSPSTLLATLRTVASIWKQEQQTRNALEIARLSGTMYDKLVGFIADMRKVKENLERADRSVNDAMKKMSDGQGNLIRTAEKIRELGAKNNKTLPSELLD